MQAISANYSGEDERPSRDSPEGEIRFFHEVFQIHTVEASYKSARADTEGTDREFEIEEHEGVAVSVENDINARWSDMLVFFFYISVEWGNITSPLCFECWRLNCLRSGQSRHISCDTTPTAFQFPYVRLLA